MKTMQEAQQNVLDWITSGENLFSQLLANKPDYKAIFRTFNEEWLNDADILVIFGTGGSSLGAKTLIKALQNKESKRKVMVLDSIDPKIFYGHVSSVLQKYKNPKFLAVSKSGETIETQAQLLNLRQIFIQINGSDKNFGKILAVQTVAGENSITKMAKNIDAYIVDHPPKVGGRYSVFSSVGLIPAMAAGIDSMAFLDSAEYVLKNFMNASPDRLNQSPNNIIKIFERANTEASSLKNNIYNRIVLVYNQELRQLGWWIRQLWAESLGKNGMGTQPVIAYGPVDQHSQMQLWLAGPQVNRFTVISYENPSSAPDSLRTIGGHNAELARVLSATRLATVKVLKKRKIDTDEIHLTKLDEKNLGRIMMEFTLETLLASCLLEVNPFDQPAVEEGKKIILKDLLS